MKNEEKDSPRIDDFSHETDDFDMKMPCSANITGVVNNILTS